MTKLYRITSYVLDLNGNNPSIDDVVDQIEANRYPEFHYVKEVLETDIGEWDDDHKLNKMSATMKDFDAYFPEIGAEVGDVWLKQEHQRVRGIMLAQIQKNQCLEDDNEDLRKEIEGLRKVRDLLSTIKDLTK